MPIISFDLLFGTMSAGPKSYWRRPIVITDMRAPLGGVIGRMQVKPEHPEDDVIDNDLILVWGNKNASLPAPIFWGRNPMDMLLIITVLLLLLFGSGGYWARGRYYW
jgi:hypothetical protein